MNLTSGKLSNLDTRNSPHISMKGLTGDSVLHITSELKPSNEVTETYCKPVRKDCQSTDLGKDTKKIVCFESPSILKRKMFRPTEMFEDLAILPN